MFLIFLIRNEKVIDNIDRGKIIVSLILEGSIEVRETKANIRQMWLSI